MASQKKIDQVKNLKDKLSKAKSFFLADYRGLKHQQLEKLKKNLKKVDGELVVAKNTLLKIALEDKSKDFERELKNPTATFFAFGDEISAIKILSDFMKLNMLPKIKTGFFEGKIATEADFTKLASLPTREVLLTTLVMTLKSPIYGLHYALQWNLRGLMTVLSNIKDKKPVN
ncbi:50S ribosomal protein L10 [Candidatus Gottesmanbacteria bacterium]|nr:50S ribosomal protein L10 [Candidatus Gottesmanbacteria bacterium]